MQQEEAEPSGHVHLAERRVNARPRAVARRQGPHAGDELARRALETGSSSSSGGSVWPGWPTQGRPRRDSGPEPGGPPSPGAAAGPGRPRGGGPGGRDFPAPTTHRAGAARRGRPAWPGPGSGSSASSWVSRRASSEAGMATEAPSCGVSVRSRAGPRRGSARERRAPLPTPARTSPRRPCDRAVPRHHQQEGGESERAQHHPAEELHGRRRPLVAVREHGEERSEHGDRGQAARQRGAERGGRRRRGRGPAGRRAPCGIPRSAGRRRRGGRGGSPPAMTAPTPARTAHTMMNASPVGRDRVPEREGGQAEAAERGGETAGPSHSPGRHAVRRAERPRARPGRRACRAPLARRIRAPARGRG